MLFTKAALLDGPVPAFSLTGPGLHILNCPRMVAANARKKSWRTSCGFAVRLIVLDFAWPSRQLTWHLLLLLDLDATISALGPNGSFLGSRVPKSSAMAVLQIHLGLDGWPFSQGVSQWKLASDAGGKCSMVLMPLR